MPANLPAERKWHRKTTEEKLRAAVFAAMREARSAPIGPSDIGRHAGLSKSLIYKYFGSVDVLVAEAIQKRLVFPVIDELLAGVDGGGDDGPTFALVSSRVSQAFRDRPDILDLIGWSLGNPHVRAVEVVTELRRFCGALAGRMTGGNHSASLFLGLIVSVLCDQQIAAAKEAQGAKNVPGRRRTSSEPKGEISRD